MNPAWKNRYEVAVDAARRAGQLALRYFDAGVETEWKQDSSPVSVADREAEALLRTTLLDAFPHDGFLGEESGDRPGDSGFRWIIDPIDGTRSFVRGVPNWATLVGLEYRGEQIAGVVEAPAMGLSYRALRGDGAYRGERRLHVSAVNDLAESVVYFTGLSYFVQAGKRDALLDLAERTQSLRGFGDFYGFVLVAQGSGEAMVDHGVHVWDVAAVKPLVEEAGGRYSDGDGRPDVYRPDAIVSNGRVHEEILRILRGRDGE